MNFLHQTLLLVLRLLFWQVYRGSWRGNTKVAVKSLKQTEQLTKEEINKFIKEAQIFMNIPPHPNIVQFLGLCFEKCQLSEDLSAQEQNGRKPKIRPSKSFQDMGGEDLKIVTEFLSAGDLVSHMRKTFEMGSCDPIGMAKGLQYLELLDLAKGISAGMDHLHQNRIIHKDLAARNILIQLMAQNSQPNEAEPSKLRVIPKISDFGLASSDKKHAMVPVRWAPPEVPGWIHQVNS